MIEEQPGFLVCPVAHVGRLKTHAVAIHLEVLLNRLMLLVGHVHLLAVQIRSVGSYRDGSHLVAVGVYIGNGKVIEAKGHKWGVVESKLKDRDFTDWGYCPWIDYAQNDDNKNEKIKYFKKYTGKSVSIVDALNSIGAKSEYSYREKIAEKNKIENYSGTPEQNTKMLKLLKKGKLIKP